MYESLIQIVRGRRSGCTWYILNSLSEGECGMTTNSLRQDVPGKDLCSASKAASGGEHVVEDGENATAGQIRYVAFLGGLAVPQNSPNNEQSRKRGLHNVLALLRRAAICPN